MVYLVLLMMVPLRAWAQLQLDEEWQFPHYVRECLARGGSRTKEPFKVDTASNPYYLRGDYDGDGRLDVAIAIISDREHSEGILVCLASSHVFLLGGQRGGVWFSDKLFDSLSDPWWHVLPRKEVVAMLVKDAQRRHQATLRALGTAPGDIIYLPWQESAAMIYYHQQKFHYYTIMSTEIPRDSRWR